MRILPLKHRLISLLFSAAAIVIVLGTSAPLAAEEVNEQVKMALDAGDTATAITRLQNDITNDPGYYFNYYVLGNIYFEREMYEQAKAQYETALDKKGSAYDALYKLGLAQLKLEELKAAKETMERGIKKDKDDKARFENGLGLVYMAMDSLSQADIQFRKAITIDDQNAEYHINLGDANFRQGIPALAIIEYEKALQLDTAGIEVYFHWAEACLETRDYKCAIEKLQIVLEKDSTFAPAWRRAGGIYFKAALSTRDREQRISRFKDVIGSYRKYFELADVTADSANVRPYFEIGLAYVNLYGFEDAITYFDSVLAIPYEPRDIYFYYGKALWGTKQYEKAADALKTHLERVEEGGEEYRSTAPMWEVYQLLGDSYYYRKPADFATAIQWYKKSLQERPGQERLIYNTAVAYHQLQRYRDALTYYDQRIELGIDSAGAGVYKNAAYCALNIANSESEGTDDIDMLDEMIDDANVEPVEDTVNYYRLAVTYMEDYLKYHPEDTKILEMIGSTYLGQLADCANAVKYYEKLLAADPKNCTAMRGLGYAYFGGVCNKNYSKALQYLKDAYNCITAEGGACADVGLTLWIAQAYHLRAVEESKDKADYENAFNWYGRVLKCDPNNADAQKGQDDTRFEF
jgi:tetratricopeptide (TPR) repeat protein